MAFEFDPTSAKPVDDAAAGFDPSTAEPVKPSGVLRKVADKAVGFGAGAAGATKAITDVAGAGNPVSGVLDDAAKGLNSLLSPEAQADQQEQQAIMAEADGKGVWEGVKAGARAFGVAPVQTAVTGLGSVVPTVAAGLATGGASVPASLATMGAVGLAQGAGTVKGAIYDDVLQRSIDAGKTPEEVRQQVRDILQGQGQLKNPILMVSPIPREGEIFVGGAVKAPGRYPLLLQDEIGLYRAIALAGGLSELADVANRLPAVQDVLVDAMLVDPTF